MTVSLSRRARAKAHRKMAFAALRSQSSASVRIKRYSKHMDTARRLVQEDAQC